MPDPGHQPQAGPAMRLRIGACEIDLAGRECRLHGRRIAVRQGVLDLIRLLVERRPAIVTHEHILHYAGPRGRAASPQWVARAVVEARRALGDDATHPRAIVNVHGVGYRFVGNVVEEMLQAHPASSAGGPAALVSAKLAQARDAFSAGGALEVSRRHAEAALALAMQHGLSLERGWALHWLGWLALWTDQPEAAVRHFSHAAQLAEDERDPRLRAQVEIADGLLRSLIGDLDRARSELTAGHAVLSRDPNAMLERYHAEHGLACVANELGQFNEALHWNRAAAASAECCGATRQAHQYRLQGLALEQRLGDELARAGQLDEARDKWREALVGCEAMQADSNGAVAPCEGLPPTERWTVDLRRGALLARLGRTNEAHQLIDALALAWSDALPGPLNVEQQRLEVYAELARLFLSEGQAGQAFRVLDCALRRVVDDDADGLELGEASALMSDVAQQCGRLDVALHWSRRRLTLQRAAEARRSRLMDRVIRAEELQDEMSRELEEVRQRIGELERLLADMLAQLTKQ